MLWNRDVTNAMFSDNGKQWKVESLPLVQQQNVSYLHFQQMQSNVTNYFKEMCGSNYSVLHYVYQLAANFVC